MVAASKGKKDFVEVLLLHGADATLKKDDDRTSLHLAACAGHADCVKPLIDAGADFFAKDNGGQTPFMLATQERKQDCIKALLRYRPVNVNDTLNIEDGTIALHAAASAGRVDFVRALLDARAVVNAKANDGRTPLALVVHGTQDCV